MEFNRMKKTNTNMPFTAETDQTPGQSFDTESIKKKQTKLTMADTINLCEYEEGKLVGSLTLAHNVIIAHVFRLQLSCQRLYQMAKQKIQNFIVTA